MTEARTHERDELHVGLRAEFEREVREEDKHQNERWYRMQSALVPLGRVCRAEDVSDVVPFLLSPGPEFVSGERIELAGGIGFASHFVAFQPGAGGYLFLHWVRSSDQPHPRTRDGAARWSKPPERTVVPSLAIQCFGFVAGRFFAACFHTRGFLE